MNQETLFQALKDWLKSQELTHTANAGEGYFELQMRSEVGEWAAQIYCESDPVLLQVLCRFPITAPQEKIAELGLVLHQINDCLRLGAYYISPEDGSLRFRFPFPILPKEPLDRQFLRATATAAGVFEMHFRTLAFCICDNAGTRVAIQKLQGKPPEPPPHVPTGGRFELN